MLYLCSREGLPDQEHDQQVCDPVTSCLPSRPARAISDVGTHHSLPEGAEPREQ